MRADMHSVSVLPGSSHSLWASLKYLVGQVLGIRMQASEGQSLTRPLCLHFRRPLPVLKSDLSLQALEAHIPSPYPWRGKGLRSVTGKGLVTVSCPSGACTPNLISAVELGSTGC